VNARIDPSMPLDEVATHIEQWRSHKKNGEQIPQQLWNEALALISTYGVSRVSRALRMSSTELDKRWRVIEAAQRRQAASVETGFVEIDGARLEQAARMDCTGGPGQAAVGSC
jgi:hypothetical protein